MSTGLWSARPRSAAPAGAGCGGLSRQPIEPGGSRHHRPLAGLAAGFGVGRGSAACRQDAPRQRVAPEVGRGTAGGSGAARGGCRRRCCRQRRCWSRTSTPASAMSAPCFICSTWCASTSCRCCSPRSVPAGELDVALPDLRSRLRALPFVTIAPPDEALLKAVLVKHFMRSATRGGAACHQPYRPAHGAIHGGCCNPCRRDRPSRHGLAPKGDASAGRGNPGSTAAWIGNCTDATEPSSCCCRVVPSSAEPAMLWYNCHLCCARSLSAPIGLP